MLDKNEVQFLNLDKMDPNNPKPVEKWKKLLNDLAEKDVLAKVVFSPDELASELSFEDFLDMLGQKTLNLAEDELAAFEKAKDMIKGAQSDFSKGEDEAK